jgi:hypothetical protein
VENEVTLLSQPEMVRLDPCRLETLYRQVGPTNAEDIICRAVEELAVRMAQCERLWQENDWTGLRKSVRSLVAIAEQVGMTRMARVALDVTRAIDQNDSVAIAATLARLVRVGERSLTAIWDLQDLSI